MTFWTVAASDEINHCGLVASPRTWEVCGLKLQGRRFKHVTKSFGGFEDLRTPQKLDSPT